MNSLIVLKLLKRSQMPSLIEYSTTLSITTIASKGLNNPQISDKKTRF